MHRYALVLLAFLLLLPGAAPAPAQQPPGNANPPANPNQQKFLEQEYEKQLEGLKDPDSIERSKAVEGLGRVGLPKGAVPLVTMAVDEKYAYLATLAAETAVKLDPEAAFATAKDLEGKKASSAVARRNLVLILRECPQPEASELILGFSDTGSKVVRLEVIRAIGLRGIAKGEGLLKAALASTDDDERNLAAIAAGRLKAPGLAASLMKGLETTDGYHCMFAALALGRMGGEDVFTALQGQLGNASGPSGEAKAKVLEAAAGPEDVERLMEILRSSSSREYREAAAIALGRLGARGLEVQELLLARMLRDSEREVRGACWHALGRLANDQIVPSLLKRAGQRDPELLKYVFYLLGDLKVEEGTQLLLKTMINEKEDMLRYAAAINFWKAADAATVRTFEEKMTTAQGPFLERGIEGLGFRKNEDGFQFLVRLMQFQKDGSNEQYLVEKSLERITGHFFGPYPGIWKKWYEKNPQFFSPKQQELERKKWRDDFDKENEGFRQTEETERAVQLGLEYLARHQSPDGRFDPQHYFENCDENPPCPKSGGARVEMDPSGQTALAVLAFLGAGYAPDEGKYKDVILRALDYLSAREQANGNFETNDLVGGYNRPLGAQAFGEAFMLTGNEEYAWSCQRAVDFITTIQNELGGWRYRVKINTTDTSCMSWNLFALKTAEKAHLDVKEIALAGCYRVMDLYSEPVKDQREEFVDIDPDYGYEVGRDTKYTFETGYQNAVWDTKYATVPLGIMARIFLGWRRSHPFCIGSANKVLEDMMEEIPKREDWSKYRSSREYPTYAWYYGTLAMHQMGGRYFREWNARIQKIIPGTQDKEGCLKGSWPGWNHDGLFGRLYTACMGTLTLETYYRYLPVLQD